MQPVTWPKPKNISDLPMRIGLRFLTSSVGVWLCITFCITAKVCSTMNHEVFRCNKNLLALPAYGVHIAYIIFVYLLKTILTRRYYFYIGMFKRFEIKRDQLPAECYSAEDTNLCVCYKVVHACCLRRRCLLSPCLCIRGTDGQDDALSQ